MQRRDYIGAALGQALNQIGATFGSVMQERARQEAVKALQTNLLTRTDPMPWQREVSAGTGKCPR